MDDRFHFREFVEIGSDLFQQFLQLDREQQTSEPNREMQMTQRACLEFEQRRFVCAVFHGYGKSLDLFGEIVEL
jgi:hypothetical protein